MTTYKLCPMNTRFEGVRYDVQVIVDGRHVAWREFTSKEAAEAYIASHNKTGGKT